MNREAIISLESAIRLAPDFALAHRYLLSIKRRLGLLRDKFEIHEKAIERVRSQRGQVERLRGEAMARVQERQVERERLRQEAILDLLKPDDEWTRTPLAAMNLTLVTGLPRAGGDMVMSMLEAGGMDLLKDGDNSTGWQRVEDLPGDPGLLEEARGRVLYAPSSLLAYLPPIHHYRILFVDRPIGEIVLSANRRTPPENASEEPLGEYEQARLLLKHRNGVLFALRAVRNVSLLIVDVERLRDTPEAEALRIQEFLGVDTLSDVSAMARAVDPRRMKACLDQFAASSLLRSPLFARTP